MRQEESTCITWENSRDEDEGAIYRITVENGSMLIETTYQLEIEDMDEFLEDLHAAHNEMKRAFQS
jgi:hypothetical protein